MSAWWAHESRDAQEALGWQRREGQPSFRTEPGLQSRRGCTALTEHREFCLLRRLMILGQSQVGDQRHFAVRQCKCVT